jgi:hypothetical protein
MACSHCSGSRDRYLADNQPSSGKRASSIYTCPPSASLVAAADVHENDGSGTSHHPIRANSRWVSTPSCPNALSDDRDRILSLLGDRVGGVTEWRDARREYRAVPPALISLSTSAQSRHFRSVCLRSSGAQSWESRAGAVAVRGSAQRRVRASHKSAKRGHALDMSICA